MMEGGEKEREREERRWMVESGEENAISFARFRVSPEEEEEKKRKKKENIGKRRVSVEQIRARFEALIFRNERVSENEIRNMTDNRDFSDREIHSNFSPPHGSPVFRLEVNPRSLISLLAVSR